MHGTTNIKLTVLCELKVRFCTKKLILKYYLNEFLASSIFLYNGHTECLRGTIQTCASTHIMCLLFLFIFYLHICLFIIYIFKTIALTFLYAIILSVFHTILIKFYDIYCKCICKDKFSVDGS
jgi:hypothetical protein